MLEQLLAAPIVPVFYHADPGYASEILEACYQGGLRVFEFTLRGERASQVFSVLKSHAAAYCPGLLLGIGTIYTAAQATQFLAAGADFIVQPVTVQSVGEACKAAGKPWIPGAFTPNEIWAAQVAGADLVKIFPGNAIGPGYVQALRGPMPDVPLMVTGGITPEAEDIRKWLQAGANAVGIGSQLFKGSYTGNHETLSKKIAGLVEAVHL
jgi:2-dehydro-3-deoxyphosphogluconate aldolase/(4S)-4-hydroxy-2-oxoglutarate aldolase